MKPAIALLLLCVPFVANARFESCARHMAEIETTDHSVLTASGRDRVGFDSPLLGDPTTDSQNYLNAIYNNFLSPYAQGHFFYQSQVFGETIPFLTNDSSIQFGMCNYQGQCVQANFQVEYDYIIVPAIVRGRRFIRYVIPTRIQTVPTKANVFYIAPSGQQFSQSVVAIDGSLPDGQPVINASPDQPDCLDNEGNVTKSYEDRGGEIRDSQGDMYDYYGDLRDMEEAWGGITIARPICGLSVVDGGSNSTSTWTCL
jgi:hypothetical protein